MLTKLGWATISLVSVKILLSLTSIYFQSLSDHEVARNRTYIIIHRQKKKNEAKKKQNVIVVKEIKMRPGIETHDYQVKLRAMNKFIGEGDKVKVTLRFRGREMAHQELGGKVLDRVREDMDDVAKVEQFPKMEGRQMTMVISPK